jgi:hypothetical protein
MRILKRLALLLAVATSLLAAGGSPEVAYTRDGALYLATPTGEVVRTVKTRVPIGGFAVAPDFSQVIFVPANGSSYGGPLYLLELKNQDLRKLSRGPYWPPVPKEADREVYADPEFSPDGASVAFAIRDVPRSRGTDMVEASGPLAAIDPRTGRVRVLQSTLNVDGQGPAFPNEPHWSPDGTRILVSFETEFAIVSADGKKLRVVAPPQLPADYDWSTALSWLGNGCIVFGVGHNGVVGRTEVLHLSSMKSEEGSERFGFALGSQYPVESLQASGSLLLVGTKKGTELFDVKTHQLLGRFPPRAKLLRTAQLPVGGCE